MAFLLGPRSSPPCGLGVRRKLANALQYRVKINPPLVVVQARRGSLSPWKAFDLRSIFRELVPLVPVAGRVEERSINGHVGTRVLYEMLATRLLLATRAAWGWQKVEPGSSARIGRQIENDFFNNL